MENVMQYVKPELLVLVPVLYLVAQGLKKAGLVANEKIPLALGGTGAALCALWLLGSSGPAQGVQGWAQLLFTALVQGLLVAGASVYCHQLVRQSQKAENRP